MITRHKYHPFLAVLAEAGLLLSVTVAEGRAQAIAEALSGLAVTPPAGYKATIATPHGRYTGIIEVKRAEDRNTGCKVGFQPAIPKTHLSQEEINRLVETPERRAVIESSLGARPASVSASELLEPFPQ